MNVPLICNLRVLSHLLLDESDYSKLLNMLSDGEKLKIDDAKVDSLDDLVKIMSEKLTSPVQLKKKRSAMEKAAIMMGSVVLTAAAVTGGIFAGKRGHITSKLSFQRKMYHLVTFQGHILWNLSSLIGHPTPQGGFSVFLWKNMFRCRRNL